MRKTIKTIIFCFIYVLILPFGGLSRLAYKLLGWTVPFHFFAESFSLIPVHFGLVIRAAFYCQTLKKCHRDLVIMFGSHFTKMDSIVGRRVIISGHTTIGLVDIADNATVGGHVSILSGRHHHNFSDVDNDVFSGESRFVMLSIGKNSFIGDNSTVMANVSRNSIVGAGSVVVNDIPDYVIAVGNPATIIKQRKE